MWSKLLYNRYRIKYRIKDVINDLDYEYLISVINKIYE